MKRFCYTLSALAIAAASPAAADTSAADLWAEWQAQAELTGQTINADATETDTGLTLSNFTTLFEDGSLTTRGAIDQVTLTENADGTVTVNYSELYSITFTFEIDPGDPPANVELQARHENMTLQVSGDPGARVYSYSADSISISDGALWGGGSEPPDIDVTMLMTDISSTYNLNGTDPNSMRFTSEGSLGGLTMVVELSPAAPTVGNFKAGITIGPMHATSEGSLLTLASMNQFNGAFPEGLEISGSTTYGPLGLEMMFEEGPNNFSVLYSNDGGSIGASVSSEAISYDIAASGASALVMGSELPAPLEISVGSSELAFNIPLSAGDAPQDMGLRVGLQDITLGESIMGMIDPGRALPRDPSSILLDATGQVQLFMDLMNINPEELTGPPGELRAITVNELQVSAAGAELSGSADLTFAPGQLVPAPVGSANLELAGGNSLLDALIAAGMVPADQGLFIRGATNIFARPGAGPDTLETTVEFGANGSITANGVPLQ